MSEKRKRDLEDVADDRDVRKKSKVKRGFRVGPDNLPDGPHRRKVQKIKSQLIERAQIKKEYSKVKRDRESAEQTAHPPPDGEDASQSRQPATAPHPDRQNLMDTKSESPEPQESRAEQRPRVRKPKATPFKREYEQAQQYKAKVEEARKAREEAMRQRDQKRDERERFHKAMAKARRGGPNGQRKLGRESHVLLEKVKRMVGQDTRC